MTGGGGDRNRTGGIGLSSCCCSCCGGGGTQERPRARRTARRKVVKLSRQLHANDPDLTEICLDEHGLRDADATRIARALKRNTHLEELHLCENYITRLGVLELSHALQDHPKIREVWLSINCMGDDGASCLARMLRTHETLRWLNLGENSIGPDGALYLSESIRHNTVLETLWLNGNKIGDGGVKCLMEALRDNPRSALTMLSLNECDITDAGAEYLAHHLRRADCRLQTLGLYGNFITDRGAIAIGQALCSANDTSHHGGGNTSLSELYLGKNKIGSLGAKTFAAALRTNATLSKLWLSNNQIGDAGASSLADILVDNKTLMELNLSRNGITQEGTRPLGRALRQNRTLVSLGMSGNTIMDEGATHLATGIGLSSITELRISEAGVSEEGALSITKNLSENDKTLAVLDMDGNKIEDAKVWMEVSAHNSRAASPPHPAGLVAEEVKSNAENSNSNSTGSALPVRRISDANSVNSS